MPVVPNRLRLGGEVGPLAVPFGVQPGMSFTIHVHGNGFTKGITPLQQGVVMKTLVPVLRPVPTSTSSIVKIAPATSAMEEGNNNSIRVLVEPLRLMLARKLKKDTKFNSWMNTRYGLTANT